jgi:hypothetical protein
MQFVEVNVYLHACMCFGIYVLGQLIRMIQTTCWQLVCADAGVQVHACMCFRGAADFSADEPVLHAVLQNKTWCLPDSHESFLLWLKPPAVLDLVSQTLGLGVARRAVVCAAKLWHGALIQHHRAIASCLHDTVTQVLLHTIYV